MKTKYPIQVIDFRFQVDHTTPKKFNCLKITELNLLTTPTKLDYLLY